MAVTDGTADLANPQVALEGCDSDETGAGRFAPTPSADLHVGNLRTALLAWLFALKSGRRLMMRIEDLDSDRCEPSIAQRQLSDLAALGINWSEPIEWQSEQRERHAAAVAQLAADGRVYECFCTRAERAAEAPHGDQGRYSNRCRTLTHAERSSLLAEGRKPSLRARLDDAEVEWTDGVLGSMSGIADDPIIRRADGVFAYNLAVVVDDAAQGVDQVVRGDDLAHAVPVQAALCDALGLPRPQWIHVPLVLGADGSRLAKRNGGTTLAELRAAGTRPGELLALLGSSLGLCDPRDAVTARDLLDGFRPELIPHEPWRFEPPR